MYFPIQTLSLCMSFYVVLINPLGWPLLSHAAPFYLLFICLCFLYSKTILKQKIMVLGYICFCLYAWFSVFTISNFIGSYSKVIRYSMEFLFLFFICSHQFSQKNIELLKKSYLSSCLLVVILLAFQHVSIDGGRRFTIAPLGHIMDPNYLSALFIFPVLELFYKCFNGNIKTRFIFYIIVLLGALLLIGSRGTIISLLLGISIIICNSKYKVWGILMFLFCSMFGIGLLFVSGGEERFLNPFDGSNTLRLRLWSTGVNVFLSSPIIGCGANSVLGLWKTHGIEIPMMVHNTYLDLLADYGILGFTLWLLPFVYLLFESRRNVLLFSVLVSTFVCSFFISAQDSCFFWQNIFMAIIINSINNKLVRENLKI